MLSRRHRFIAATTLMIVSTLIMVGVCEAVLRLVLFSETFAIPIMQKPRRYADPWVDEDFYKLEIIFSGIKNSAKNGDAENRKIRSEYHPLFGWTPIASPKNPLGLVTDKQYQIDDLGHPILFYGDSYVAGHTPVPYRIPQILDRMFPERPVLNYGVWGYGVDQIYLRFRETVVKFQDPVVLVGIQDGDLDRSILSIRGRPKPYFDIQDDELVLRNTPVFLTRDEFLERNPPEIRSYFFRLFIFRLRPMLPERWFDGLFGYEETRAKKRIINRRIFRAFKDEASALNLPIYFVLFFRKRYINEVTWREAYLHQTLDELGIPYFDTKAYLKDYISEKKISVEDIWSTAHGHPNEDGNRVLAEGIFNWLITCAGYDRLTTHKANMASPRGLMAHIPVCHHARK